MNERPWTTESPSGDPDRDEREPHVRDRDGLDLDRRGFLKVVGIGAAASLAACERLPVHHVLPFAVAPEDVRAGQAIAYAGTCTACEARCGLMATVRDGRPIKLEGHPDDPRTRGGLCSWGQADLRALYDPDRLRGPTERGEVSTWKALDAEARRRLSELAADGRSLLVVSGPETSPTLRRQLESFVSGRGRWIELDLRPESPVAATRALEELTGDAARARVDWSAVDLVVSLASDFLGTGPDPVADTRGYSDRRREAETRGPLAHVQVEGSLSLTGAAADRRFSARAHERRLFARHLLRAVAEEAPSDRGGEVLRLLPAAGAEDPWVARAQEIAQSLWAASPGAVVLCGEDDAEEQQATAAVNELIGAYGGALRLEIDPTPATSRGVEDLETALAEESLGGAVFIEVDPVRQLPFGERIAARLSELLWTVAVSARPNATTRACLWVAAAHHGLEAWGDHRTSADRLKIQQPMIRPLFDTRSALECLLHWSSFESSDGRAHLKEAWKAHVPRAAGVDFERFWHESISAGAVELAGAPGFVPDRFDLARAAQNARQISAEPSAAAELELELIAEVAVRDGRRAHVPWLRELPDPLTRVSWVPVARISPSLAERLGIEDGAVLEIQCEAGVVRLPAVRLPGQAESVIALPLGYDGEPESPGLNVSRLLPGRVGRGTLPITRVRPTGQRVKLPRIQVWSSAEGRPIVHQVASHGEHVEAGHHGASASLWGERPRSSPQWHMTIDLDACTGCGACVVACQVENNIPVVGEQGMRDHRDMHWLRIDRYFQGGADDPDVLFEPMLCAQCDKAPCETVCPVAATAHSADGLNQQAYNRCVGTRYCANNCPYKVRRFNWFDYRPQDPIERLVLNPEVVVRTRGVMEKCTFCVQRVQAARLAARRSDRPGVPEVRTACQQSCPAAAIRFGDATDPDGEIARTCNEPRAFQVLAELGIEPSVTYLARVRTRPGRSDEPGSKAHGG